MLLPVVLPLLDDETDLQHFVLLLVFVRKVTWYLMRQSHWLEEELFQFLLLVSLGMCSSTEDHRRETGLSVHTRYR